MEKFGFGSLKPVPCSDRATKLAAAILGVVNTQKALEEAYDHVPDYTGQWEPADYYAQEQENFNRACERFELHVSTSETIYEPGDYVELTPQRTAQQPELMRRFAIVQERLGHGHQHIRYTLNYIGARGLVTNHTVRASGATIIGLSNRKAHYEADEPYDVRDSFEDQFGESRVPTIAQSDAFIQAAIAAHEDHVAKQVTGFLLMERGAAMSDMVRSLVIEGIDEEDVSVWSNPEERAEVLSKFREMVTNYPAFGEKTEMPHQPGLFEMIAQHRS